MTDNPKADPVATGAPVTVHYTVQTPPRTLLLWIRSGIVNGNYGAALDVIDQALRQIPESATFSIPVSDIPATRTPGDE